MQIHALPQLFKYPFSKNIIQHPLSLVLVLLLTLSSCKKDREPQRASEARTIMGLSYGSDPKQKMDVYLPANRSSETGVIILVHGGGFVAGDRTDFTAVLEKMKDKNYAIVNVSYRLVDTTGLLRPLPLHKESAVKVKDQVDDMALIVDHVISQSGSWVVSNRKIGMAGHSAGGTLVLLYAYDARNTGKVSAVANLAGALDVSYMDLPLLEFIPPVILEAGYRLTGYTVTPANEMHYKAISPLYVANADRKVPTLNVFPERNIVGDLPKQGISTYNAFTLRLNQLGIPNKFVQIDGADHGFGQPGNFDQVGAEMQAYFDANL